MKEESFEARLFADFAHQVKGPLYTAVRRLNDMLEDEKLPRVIAQDLLAVRGMCQKASRMTTTAYVLDSLHRRKLGADVNCRRMSNLEVIAIIQRCVEDACILISPRRSLKIEADKIQMLHQAPDFLHVDLNLLELAIANVLDNAIKYSFPETKIVVTAQRKNDMYEISIINRGIQLSPADATYCVERGWRGAQAQQFVGEGSGIGLWIANVVMLAQQGRLNVNPTDNSGMTTVKLVLAIK